MIDFRGYKIADFTPEEFACKHCGQVLIHPYFVEDLQKGRDKFGTMRINSGYRCPVHNREIGGAENSIHLFGLAADVAFIKVDWSDPVQVSQIMLFFKDKTAINRIGLYSWGLHLDKFHHYWRYWWKDGRGYHYKNTVEEVLAGYFGKEVIS